MNLFVKIVYGSQHFVPLWVIDTILVTFFLSRALPLILFDPMAFLLSLFHFIVQDWVAISQFQSTWRL